MIPDNSDHELLLLINTKVDEQQKELADLRVYCEKLDLENDLMRESVKTRTKLLSAIGGTVTAICVGLFTTVNIEYQTENTKVHFGLDSETVQKVLGIAFTSLITGVPASAVIYDKLKRQPLKVERLPVGDTQESS